MAPNLAKLEEEILRFWKENKIFEKSIEKRPIDNPASFYDGPPFVTGVPHYGHLLGSIAKDIIPRYLTMKGKRVRRLWGWDCHGLPIENKVEQRLGLKNRRDIEKVGLLKFINECQNYVSKTSAEWNWYVEHVGRWVDMEHAYRTMDLSYMESVIWAFKKLYDQGLIYKGRRISLFCPRCSTPVSNFEIAMDNSYANREDVAIIMKFRIIDQQFIQKYQLNKPAYLLAWTTTPWSCVSVMGLAVGIKFPYQIVEADEEFYLIATERTAATMAERNYRLVKELDGKDISDLRYEHLFNYYDGQFTDFKTHPADYVSDKEGTGIVTINGAFGEVDMDTSLKYNLPIIVNVDEEGKFTPEVAVAPGLYVKDGEKLIIEDIKSRRLLFKAEKIVHSYPFCYRCEAPLIYRAQDSWFINVQKLKPQLLKNNVSIHWVPEHFKDGRFSEGIKTAPDWCISRTRYWATAMPIWECQQCEKREVFGSIKEIEDRSGQKVKDLHRPFIDEITFKCDKCGGRMVRVKEVLDCWLESGSMPYAERHYPFENKDDFEKSFPADYISEYSGQVRAWFYVLHVLSTALFNSCAFKNVVVSGVIKGTDGRKMSKSFNNYPDPRLVIEKYGGDALRLYLMGSPTMAGQDMNISEEGIKEQARKTLLVLWNCYNYFKTFANSYGFKPRPAAVKADNLLDAWILSRNQRFLKNFTRFLDDYHVPEAVRLVTEFLDDLSRWYIRRSRQRFKNGDKAALATLYWVLVLFIKTTAPLIPFMAEVLYQGLVKARESVHLEDWPMVEEDLLNDELEEKMAVTREIAGLALAQRAKIGIKVRQPLASLRIKPSLFKAIKGQGLDLEADKKFFELIKDEINVKEIIFAPEMESEIELNGQLTPELKEEGLVREIIRQIQEMRKKSHLTQKDKITISFLLPAGELKKILVKWSVYIKKETIAKAMEAKKEGDSFLAEREISIDSQKLWLGIKVVGG